MKITIALTLTFLSFFSNSQSLTNENFESWIDNSAFIDPEGWVTLNDFNAEYGLPITVVKTTDAKEGQYAAHMQTFTFVDGNNNTDTLPALMVYGTDINSGVTYSWSKRLKTISFTYKYKPNGIDTGVMYLTTGYRDRKTNTYITHGFAFYLFTKKEETYTKVNIPVFYASNHKCDTFSLVFANSIETTKNRNKPGTILIIDDIDTEWEEFPAVAISEIEEVELGLYPNPATDLIHIKGLSPGFHTAKIVDITGKTVLSELLMNESLNIENIKPGFYYLIIQSTDGTYSGSNYFIKK